MVINRVGPVSVAKISGTLYAIVGLFIGGVFSLIALAGSATHAFEAPGFGALMGIAAIVVFPILYGALGFIGALIMAGLYNFLAGIVGGVELDIR